MRLDPGDVVVASDGLGSYVPCELHVSRGALRRSGRPGEATAGLDPIGTVIAAEAPAVPVTVGFALHKGDRPDWAVEKLTELGIDKILVLTTERTVVRPHGAEAERRVARLRRVARQACAQSRRVRLPVLDGPIGFAEALASATGRIAVAEPGGPPFVPGTTTILVGPEGGLTDSELARAPALVGLSDTILRTETAAVSAGVLLSAFRRAG